MSLLTRIFARRKAQPSPNMDLERRIWHDYYDYGEESEVWWWPEQSLKVAAVWRCVNIVCNALSSIPWRVMRIEEDGRMQDKMHPLHQLLEISPNEEMTPASFRETMISHILLHGNAYAEIVRDNRGYPQEMWLIAPDRVEPRRNEMGRLEYKISQSGGQMVYLKPNEIFHVPGLSFDGIRGYSILDVADRSLSNALRIDKFTSNYFKHAMQPSGRHHVVARYPGHRGDHRPDSECVQAIHRKQREQTFYCRRRHRLPTDSTHSRAGSILGDPALYDPRNLPPVRGAPIYGFRQ